MPIFWLCLWLCPSGQDRTAPTAHSGLARHITRLSAVMSPRQSGAQSPGGSSMLRCGNHRAGWRASCSALPRPCPCRCPSSASIAERSMLPGATTKTPRGSSPALAAGKRWSEAPVVQPGAMGGHGGVRGGCRCAEEAEHCVLERRGGRVAAEVQHLQLHAQHPQQHEDLERRSANGKLRAGGLRTCGSAS